MGDKERYTKLVVVYPTLTQEYPTIYFKASKYTTFLYVLTAGGEFYGGNSSGNHTSSRVRYFSFEGEAELETCYILLVEVCCAVIIRYTKISYKILNVLDEVTYITQL